MVHLFTQFIIVPSELPAIPETERNSAVLSTVTFFTPALLPRLPKSAPVPFVTAANVIVLPFPSKVPWYTFAVDTLALVPTAYHVSDSSSLILLYSLAFRSVFSMET